MVKMSPVEVGIPVPPVGVVSSFPSPPLPGPRGMEPSSPPPIAVPADWLPTPIVVSSTSFPGGVEGSVAVGEVKSVSLPSLPLVPVADGSSVEVTQSSPSSVPVVVSEEGPSSPVPLFVGGPVEVDPVPLVPVEMTPLSPSTVPVPVFVGGPVEVDPVPPVAVEVPNVISLSSPVVSAG